MLDLATEFQRLDEEQKLAVKHRGNTAVLAGPGSGKTATLVLKVADLMSAIVPAPQGVACITFNNDAVTEFRSRLAKHGIRSSRRLFLGTVHSFCLNCIIRTYGAIVSPELAGVAVVGEQAAGKILEEVALEYYGGAYFPSIALTLTRLRRALACGEDVSGFDDRDFHVAKAYEEKLAGQGLIDFESIVLGALKLVEEESWVCDLLAARFPWLIVDEYQDLGGPLHRIVTTLVDRGGVNVFAVGDPDQTVYEFTGADPKYLRELTQRPDFKAIQLRFNYRSGGDLIIAGEAVLAPEQPRGYAPDPRRGDRGRIEFRRAQDDLQDHARLAADAVCESSAAGTPPHEIAVLYRAKHELLSDLKETLERAGIQFVPERDSMFPRSPMVRWLQEGAGWAISPSETRETRFIDLLHPYFALLEEAGRIDRANPDLMWTATLHGVLAETSAEDSLGTWMGTLDRELEIAALLRRSRHRSSDDLENWEALASRSLDGDLKRHTVRDFADDGRTKGKVVLTTLHSSKGRQFDVVVLPGLVEGLMPPKHWDRSTRRMEDPSPGELQAHRRLFYVGFSRARHVVYLIYSDGYQNSKGYFNSWGPSRFAVEISSRLSREAEGES